MTVLFDCRDSDCSDSCWKLNRFVCQSDQLTDTHIDSFFVSMFSHIPKLCRLNPLPLLFSSSCVRLNNCGTTMKLAPTVKLNNGYEMPILGLGTYNVSAY